MTAPSAGRTDQPDPGAHTGAGSGAGGSDTSADAGTSVRPSAQPASLQQGSVPDAARQRAGVPGAAQPGAALPGSARSGSALPGTLDLSVIAFSGDPLLAAPLAPGELLLLMGRDQDVENALGAVATLPGTRMLRRPAVVRQRVGAWLKEHTGVRGSRALPAALRRAGLGEGVSARTRLRDLDATARARLLIAALNLLGTGRTSSPAGSAAAGAAVGEAASAADSERAAHSGQVADPGQAALPGAVTHVVIPYPFDSVPGHLRAGVRSALVRELRAAGLGAVLSSDSPVDAVVLGAQIVELDAEQVAQTGDATTVLGKPRGGLSASLGGANVMSGLARGGWLSIGHSQVRRRTELDGKVYLAIPTDAVRLSADEFDPSFTGEAVFEVLVVGTRDEGTALQLRLSPADTEAGLPLVADLLDAAPRRAWAAAGTAGTASAGRAGWAILHPGLGDTVEEQLRAAAMGTRLWAEVDTDRIHVWSVEE